jgi:hypothetical protein
MPAFSNMEGKTNEEQRLEAIKLLAQAANGIRSLANAKKILPYDEADSLIEQFHGRALKGMEALQQANNTMMELPDHVGRAIIMNGQQLLKQDGTVKADQGLRSMMHAVLDHQSLNMCQPALSAIHNNHMISFDFHLIPGGLYVRREDRNISTDIMRNVITKAGAHLSTCTEITTGPLFREMLERLFELASVVHGEEPMHLADKMWRAHLKTWRKAKWLVDWCIKVWLQHCEEFSSHLRQWAIGLGGISRPKPNFLVILPQTAASIAEYTTRAHLQDAEDPNWNGSSRQQPAPKRTRLTPAPAPSPSPSFTTRGVPTTQVSDFVTRSVLPRLNRAIPQHTRQMRDKIIEVASRSPSAGGLFKVCFNMVSNQPCPRAPDCKDTSGTTLVCYHNINTA